MLCFTVNLRHLRRPPESPQRHLSGSESFSCTHPFTSLAIKLRSLRGALRSTEEEVLTGLGRLSCFLCRPRQPGAVVLYSVSVAVCPPDQPGFLRPAPHSSFLRRQSLGLLHNFSGWRAFTGAPESSPGVFAQPASIPAYYQNASYNSKKLFLFFISNHLTFFSALSLSQLPCQKSSLEL